MPISSLLVSVPQSILFATSNEGKLREARQILSPMGIEVAGLDLLDGEVDEPVEDQPTFEGNALLKARHYATAAGRPCLADDSGLCVDALGGAPGVISARFAGVDGDRAVRDRANNDKLLEALADVPDERRTARFVCVMVLADAEMTYLRVRGTVEGRIAHAPAGDNGFGYDPLFVPDGMGRSVAELGPAQKNAISHRGNAVRELVAALGTMERRPIHSDNPDPFRW